MPQLTPKLGIKKPLGNETVKRESFNENWDIIDEQAAAQAELDAHMAETSAHGATSLPTPGSIIQRDADGRAKVAAPSAPDDIARKAETDAALSAAQAAQTTANAALPKSGGTMTGPLSVPLVEGDRAIPDTRSVNINPGDLSKAESIDFKNGNIIGLPSGYYVVYTMRGWTDDTGGPATQIAYGENGPAFIRKGTSAGGWQAWQEVITSVGNKTINGTIWANELAGTNAGGAGLDLQVQNTMDIWMFRAGPGIRFDHNTMDIYCAGNRVWNEGRLRWNNGELEYNNGGTWTPVGGIKSVQRGTATVSGPSAVNVTISTVNLSKTFVTCSWTGATYLYSSDGYTETNVRVRLTSTTNLEIYNNSRATGDVAWEVVESY